MSTCKRCGKVYREPEDEQGDHPCPKCGYEWWEVVKGWTRNTWIESMIESMRRLRDEQGY